jgi:hypothetical protein
MRRLDLRVWLVSASLFLGNAGHYISPAHSEDFIGDGHTALRQPLSVLAFSSAMQSAPVAQTLRPVLPANKVMAEAQPPRDQRTNIRSFRLFAARSSRQNSGGL